MLDKGLEKSLSAESFLDILKDEIKEQPFDSLLSEKRRHLSDIDAVPSYTDYPAQTDELGRRSFAEVLAIRGSSQFIKSSPAAGLFKLWQPYRLLCLE